MEAAGVAKRVLLDLVLSHSRPRVHARLQQTTVTASYNL